MRPLSAVAVAFALTASTLTAATASVGPVERRPVPSSTRPAGSWAGAPIEVGAGRAHGLGAAIGRTVAANAGGRATRAGGFAAAARPTSGRDPLVDFVGNSFHDRCEGLEAFDLKKLSIIDDGASEVVLVWGTCPGVTAPASAGDAIAFIIDDGPPSQGGTYEGPNLVVVQHTRDASFEVFDTNGSSDEAAWRIVQQGMGTVSPIGTDRGGPRTVGEIPIDAVDAQFPLQYQIAAVTLRDDEVGDVVPERDMPPIAFPFSCDYFELHSARITTAAGTSADRAGSAKAQRLVRGLGARVTSRTSGSFLATPLSDADVAALDALPGVAAERPAMFRAFSDPEPTQWAIDQVRLPQAWGAVARSAGTIAVLDQGVDGGRADLAGRVGAGFNAFTNELYGAAADSALGVHGTSVAGIIAGTRDNRFEVAGVNDRATILPVLVFDHANCADDQTIAAGLDWAVGRGAKIINLSLGGPRDTQVLRDAIKRASAAGALILAATGNNDDVSPGVRNWPAAYPEVIGVGATGPGAQGPVVADYSQRAAVELVAPGGINSGDRASDFAVLAEWDGVEYQAGTSFAAPFVAGLASLWFALHPGATAAEARAALDAAATDLPGDRDGAGLVDAVALLGDTPPPGTDPDAAPDGVPAAPRVDGDPATTHRLDTLDPVVASVMTSKARFATEATAPVAVVARRDTFADALSAAALTAQGPLLFTDSVALDPRAQAELSRVLAPDGTIYLLGGTSAISVGIERQLREEHPNARIHRLGGANRYETSRSIVRETVARHGRAGQLLLARGFGPATDPNGTAAWADAISGGAFAASRRIPLLIVRSDNLGPSDLDVIAEVTRPDGIVSLLGGTSALAPAVLDAAGTVRQARRVRGPDRDATAAAVAQTLWGVNPTGARTFVILNTHGPQGWFLGLASAGYAAQIGAPILSTRTSLVPEPTATLVSRCGAPQVELWIAGAAGAVSAAVVGELDRLDGRAC